ncbi:hypothetical protein ACFVVL_09055 [Kitasatospora sp. NPDC058115]|uniref:hypothetical protein n=1 Tax=Kitasatospora sp. NPDC058115 TaxID=3346347 RepID=UPI0036DF44BE
MTVLHTVRLAPADGPAPSAGAPGPHVEARIHSPAGVCHGLLATRPPAGRSGGPLSRVFVDEHLALDLADPDAARWRHHADVLHLGTAAPGRLTTVLRAHPGCAVATADGEGGTLLVLTRTGGRLTLRPRPGSSGPASSAQRLAAGSLAHAWLAAGRTLGELTALATSAYTARPPCPGCPLAT